MKLLLILFTFITTITHTPTEQNTNVIIQEQIEETTEKIEYNIKQIQHYLIFNGTYYVISNTIPEIENYNNIPATLTARNIITIIKKCYQKLSVEEFVEKYETFIKNIDLQIANILKKQCENNTELYNFVLGLIEYLKI